MTPPTPQPDFRIYYDLEGYLFDTVSPRFHAEHTLSAFDFFCIVIWKANRAKSRIAKRLLSHANYTDLDSAVKALTAAIAHAPTPKEKLQVLLNEWGFLLPMASAILTVLYPDDFTVYDIRVCDILGDFHWVGNRSKFEDIWTGYTKYTAAVRANTPAELSLRDKDRWLWGKSFYNDLVEDLNKNFVRSQPGATEKES